MFIKESYKVDKELNNVIDDLLLEEELFEDLGKERKEDRLDIKRFELLMRKLYKLGEKREPKTFLKNNLGSNSVIISLTKANMIKDVMDFLKSINQRLYIEALRLFTGVSRNQEVSIYNFNDVKDFGVRDEYGLHLFEKTSMRMSENGKSKIYVVLFEELGESFVERINSLLNSGDMCSFKDMFKLIHELAHGFDKKVPEKSIFFDKNLDGKMDNKELPENAEAFLSETTAIFFECLLGDYLIKKNAANRVIVNLIISNRINSNRECVFYAGIKSALMVKKMEDGLVDENDFLQILASYDEDDGDFIKEMLKDEPFLYTDRKYAMAELLVPTMIKRYRENEEKGKERLVDYLESVKRNDFTGALAAFDISLTKNGIYELLANVNEFEKEYLEERDIGER